MTDQNDDIMNEESPAAPVQDAAEDTEMLPATSNPETESSGGSFASFGFCEELMRGITEAGFTEPTPIQAKAIPYILQGRDVMGQALTGTGKTAAFGLPSLQKIHGRAGLQFLVLVPTRELAAQVSSEIYRLGQYTGIRTAAFTGGQSYYRQEQLLREGIHVLVATPGRLIDLMESGHFDHVQPSVIVVDEADEMLDMGFLDDVKTIFENFDGEHQTMLFSATMPRQIIQLAKEILRNPVDITTDIRETANNSISQHFFVIEEHERVNAIIRLIDSDEVKKAIIFCRTREETDSLNILLGGRGYNVNCLHGDMEQAQRSRVMAAFRRNEIDILVATDVAARGLDVDDVTHVFNYHLPFDSRSYVHRIGRTGRAGREGKAITLITPRELRQLEAIRRNVGAEITCALIPTRQEVNLQRIEKLLGELFGADLNTDLYNQIRQMSELQDQDITVLFTKLVTKFLRQTSDHGPDQIGLSGERLERVLHPKRDKRDRERPHHRDSRKDRRRIREESPENQENRDFRNEKNRRERSAAFSDDGTGKKYQDRPFRRERFEDREDRPFRRERFEEREDRPYRKECLEDREDRPFRRERFEERGDRPYGKDRSENYEDRPRNFRRTDADGAVKARRIADFIEQTRNMRGRYDGEGRTGEYRGDREESRWKKAHRPDRQERAEKAEQAAHPVSAPGRKGGKKKYVPGAPGSPKDFFTRK